MATVNKDFKIKSGLIVEGTTGTINNHDILTKKPDDQNYIIGLIGGSATPDATPETVVLRDENANFSANMITSDITGDVTGNADTATALETARTIELTGDVTGSVSFDGTANVQISTSLNGSFATDAEVATAKSEAIADAEDYTDARETEITSAYQSYADQAEADAVATAALDATNKANAAEAAANSYTDDEISALDLSLKAYADQAESDAVSTASADATTKANAAQAAAELTASNALSSAVSNLEDYADQAQADAESFATAADTTLYGTVTSDIATAKQEAISAAEDYTDAAVANLVDGAPALLDTLNELAAAIADNPNYATDVANLVATKADTTYVDQEIADAIQTTTYTAGTNIDITNNQVSVTGLDTDDVSEGTNLYFTNQRALDATAQAYDLVGSASAAQSAAESYTNSAITQEVSDRNSAISSAINTEISDRNTAINSAIATEVIDRDAAISTAIQNLNSDVQTDIETAISQEVFNRNEAIATEINALDTDDIEEGTNQYFTSTRAKVAAASLITSATKTNIVITGDENGLTITAENGVADSDTDDLVEGSSNLYFTDARAVSALEAVTPDFPAVEISSIAKQVAAEASVATASTNTAVSWAKANYRSAEFLVKIANGTHTEVSKVVLTLDSSDNIAITEYAMVGTNGSLGSVSADVSGDDVRLRVTTSNNTSTVAVVGTLLK